MDIVDFLEKYNLLSNDARNEVDKKTHLAKLIGKAKDRLNEALRIGKGKIIEQEERHLQKLGNYGSKKGRRYKVPVKGTFEYEAEVYANTEEEAADLASVQVTRIAPSLKLKVGKVGKPKI